MMAAERVLIVTYSFSPHQNPRALRWGSIAEYWAAHGVEVDVVTGYAAGLPAREQHDGVNVYRVGKGLLEFLRSVAARRRSGRLHPGSTAQIKTLTQGGPVRWLYDLTWKQLYWPDYACLWISPAARKVSELLATHRYSVVISVSDPYSGHVAVRNAFKNGMPGRWLVDISDPFSFRELATPNNQRIYALRNSELETGILTGASSVSVTTEATAREYASRFPYISGKLHVIGPMMAAPGEDRTTEGPESTDGRRKLVFVGTLYSDLRNPSRLLDRFSRLTEYPGFEKTELHFYGGAVGRVEALQNLQPKLRDNVFVHGLVPREQVLAAIRSADVLVNIGNRGGIQLPSKVVEYTWTGKPIWNLVDHVDDCSSEYLRGYPVLLDQLGADQSANDPQVDQLASFLTNAPAQVPESQLARWRERSSVETISRQYADLCCLALNGDRSVSNRSEEHRHDIAVEQR